MPLAPGRLRRWQAHLIMHPAAFKCTDKNLLTEYKICSFTGTRQVLSEAMLYLKTQPDILIF